MVNELGITTPKSLLENISNIDNNIGTLSNLTTTNKSNLVSSINEVNNTTPKLLTKKLTLTVGLEGILKIYWMLLMKL